MGFTINVDTGGTFTDGYFTGNNENKFAKVLTTHHDLTESLLSCITEGAKLFGCTLNEMLSQTDIIRYSTTIGTNTVITKSGPKVGLILTKGFEKSLYQSQDLNADTLTDTLLNKDHVIGVKESIDHTGRITKNIDLNECRQAVEELADVGARIVVSFRNSYFKPVHEHKIAALVAEEFPKHYLGHVPVLLASQLAAIREDFVKTNTAVVNAYLHRDMVKHLYKAEDELHKAGYNKPLMIVNGHGGLSRVAKTSAIQTFSSGPAAGVFGGLSVAKLYGVKEAVVSDMGGTSFDIGRISNGSSRPTSEVTISGLPVRLRMIPVRSIGAGGSSIAEIDDKMKSALKVGPRSAGSIPGPACFDLGGYEPTVTDADLVLGYIDPKYFLGGRMKLDRNKAALAIKEHIALPLNLDVIEAAALIKRTVDATMATALSNEVGREQKIAQPTILVYGGAGPTHCCGFLKPIKDPMIVTFPFSSVFCAFGASTMTVTHYYEVKYNAELQENKINIHQFNIALQNLKTKAITDMTGEGVSLKNIQFDVEVQIFSEESNRSVSFLSPVFFVRNRKEIRLVCKAAQSAFRQIGTKDGALWIENITLKATASNTDQIQRSYQKSGKDPRLALKGRRDSYSNDGLRKTAVYENRRLQPGNILKGPALVEGEDMTLVLEEGFNYEVDEFRNGIIKRSFGD